MMPRHEHAALSAEVSLIMGLVNHAKELGARYAADWPEPLPSGMESGDEPRRRNP